MKSRRWFRFSLARALGSITFMCIAAWMATKALGAYDPRPFLWYAWLAGSFLGAGVGTLVGQDGAKGAAIGFLIVSCVALAALIPLVVAVQFFS